MLEALLALALNNSTNTMNNSVSDAIKNARTINQSRYLQGPFLPQIYNLHPTNTIIPPQKERVDILYKKHNTFSITISTKYLHIKLAPRFYVQKQNPLICNSIPQ